MASVGRLVKMKAREGQGDALAAVMLRVSEGLQSTPGCELYVINRSRSEPDVVWVNELWLSQEAIDASLQALQREEGQAQVAEVMELLDGEPQRLDLEPLGGVGFLTGGKGSTLVNLEDVEDQAPRFGYGHIGEARFAGRALSALRTGLSHHRLRPNARQAFGHSHHHAEEVYVVLAGNGRIKIDDEIHSLRTRDVIRIAPESVRAAEAGPEGLELLVVGPRHPGDVVMASDFWPTQKNRS